MLWSRVHLKAKDITACVSAVFENQSRTSWCGSVQNVCCLTIRGSFTKALQVSAQPTKLFSGTVDIGQPPFAAANTKPVLYLPSINSQNNPEETLGT